MGTELTVGTEMGKSLEELMGIANMGGSTESKQPSLARVGMIHQAVMGDVDVGVRHYAQRFYLLEHIK